MNKEPTRLTEGEAGSLGEEIRALRERVPSSKRLAALAERLAAAGASVGAPTQARRPELTQGRGPTPARVLDPSVKLIVAALIASGVLIGVALWSRSSDVPLAPQAVPARVGSAAPDSSVPTTSPRESAAFAPSAASSGDAAPARTRPVTSAEAETTSDLESNLPPSTASTATTPPAPSHRPASDVPRSQLGPHPPIKASQRGAEEANTGAALADSTVVVSEVELLKQARSALGADPAQAFALTERCRAQYPSGGFAQEREFIAISALYRMGRVEEARSRLSLFTMHYPSSAYLPTLTRLFGRE